MACFRHAFDIPSQRFDRLVLFASEKGEVMLQRNDRLGSRQKEKAAIRDNVPNSVPTILIYALRKYANFPDPRALVSSILAKLFF